jgi:DNA-binding transcriptional LysR family regulator
MRSSPRFARKGPHFCGAAPMFDWNDLRHFLSVARSGSTIAAAKALGVSQSTVQRRLVALEVRLGRAVAVRTSSGYELTKFGRELLPLAEKIEVEVLALSAYAAKAGQSLIRLTCPEPIIPRLRPLIMRFEAQNPQFQVEFVTSDRYLDLAAGDADIAFRSGDTDADLVGRKVADSSWAVYAARSYVAAHGQPRVLAELVLHPLVTFDDTMARHRVVTWLAEVAPKAHIAARASSVLGLLQSVRSGLGVGPLPANIADAEPELERVLGPVPELARTWRLLTPSALRKAPRIAAFFDFVEGEREAVRAILN